MENKSNEATPLRPQGERMLNAPVVEIDLYRFINQIKEEKPWIETGHNSITVFKSDKLRIVLIGLNANASIKEHLAASVISVQVLEGKIDFTVEGKIITINKGQMLALQKDIPHSVYASEESFFLLTLSCI